MKSLQTLFIRLLIFSMVVLPSGMNGANLVGVVVANTLPREENLGREYDVLKIIEELETISDKTGLQLDLYLYIHEEFNSNIFNKLENISVHSDDVLFFYFSGHGYRDQDKDPEKNPWPNLHLPFVDKGIDHQDITEILQAKGPRLFFSLVNSCNKNSKREIELVRRELDPRSLLAANSLMMTDAPSMMADGYLGRDNYKKLFLEKSGVIISSSSIPEQYSFRNKDSGTVYLEAFLSSLHEEAEMVEEPDWESVFAQTVMKTVVMSRGKQIPQYALHLEK